MQINPVFARYVLGPAMVILLLGLISPGIIGSYIILDTQYFSESESNLTTKLTSWLLGSSALPKDIVTAFNQAVPAILVVVCFREKDSSSPSIVGWLSVLILLVGLALSCVVLLFVNPGDQNFSTNFISGKEGLQAIWNSAQSAATPLGMRFNGA